MSSEPILASYLGSEIAASSTRDISARGFELGTFKSFEKVSYTRQLAAISESGEICERFIKIGNCQLFEKGGEQIRTRSLRWLLAAVY